MPPLEQARLGGKVPVTQEGGRMNAFRIAALCGLGLVCCSKDPEEGGFADGGPVDTGGASGTGGAPGDGAQTGSGGGAEDPCPSRSFSTAPLECLQDWSHAKDAYPDVCARGAPVEGGCQA